MDEDNECCIVGEEVKNLSAKKKKKSPLHQKTKQARLSFTTITSEKKRKHSGSLSEQQPAAKKPPLPSSAAKTSKCHLASDEEVSSSCDDNKLVPQNNSNETTQSPTKSKSKSANLLQKFVRREPTQQAEISTSVEENDKKQKSPNKSLSSESPKSKSDTNKRITEIADNESTSNKNSSAKLTNKRGRGKKNQTKEKSKEDAKNLNSEKSKDVKEPKENSTAVEIVDLDSSPVKSNKKIRLDNEAITPVQKNRKLLKRTVKGAGKNSLITAFVKKGVPRPVESVTTKVNEENIQESEPEVIEETLTEKSSSEEKSDNNVSDCSKSLNDTADKISPNENDKTCDDSDINTSSTSTAPSINTTGNNESVCSTPTGVRNNKSSKKASTPIVSNNAAKSDKLTPKTLAKELEKKQKEEERIKKKDEKVQQRKQKEEEKAKLKQEKDDELKKQRDEKEQLKEEKLRKKQEEVDTKNKEREEKKLRLEEDKLKKEEEKQKKDDEKKAREEEKKRVEEEEKNRKEKVAAKFANFFVPNKTEEPTKPAELEKDVSGPFMQMQVSRNTVLAPVCRCRLSSEAATALEAALKNAKNAASSTTYLTMLASSKYVPGKQAATPKPTPVIKTDPDECVIVEEKDDDEDELEDDDDFPSDSAMVLNAARKQAQKLTAKLLQFCENRRPAYWGTWTKQPIAVAPRRPLAREEIFDYEYDSDDDWEEEEGGESLSDSDGEKDEEEDEQYEVDNDFFVPHGYLSDDEGQDDGGEDEGNKENTDINTTEDHVSAPTDNKEKLKAKQAEFEKELKKQTKQLKPRVYGCLWLHDANSNSVSRAQQEHLTKLLQGYTAVVCTTPAADNISDDGADAPMAVVPQGIPCLPPTPPATPAVSATPFAAATDAGDDSVTGSSKKVFYKTFPDEAVSALIRLVHGNRHKKQMMAREFSHYWRQRQMGSDQTDAASVVTTPLTATPSQDKLSNRKIEFKIAELAVYERCPEEGPCHNQAMWFVSAAVRTEHGVTDAPLPNAWMYTCITPKSFNRPGGNDLLDTPKISSFAPVTNSKQSVTSLITKFTKVLTEEEKAAALNKKVTPLKKIAASTPSGKSVSPSGNISLVSPMDCDDITVIYQDADCKSGKSPANKIISSSIKKSVKSTTKNTPSTPSITKVGVKKKRISLISSPRQNSGAKSAAGSIIGFLKKPGTNGIISDSCIKLASKTDSAKRESVKPDDNSDCITLD